jgi:hypothetical protein
MRPAIEAESEVYLVQVSNGFPSVALLFFCILCWREHNFRYSGEQLVEARLAQFRTSAAVLGSQPSEPSGRDVIGQSALR